jgi:hypothetical protein
MNRNPNLKGLIGRVFQRPQAKVGIRSARIVV